MITHNPPFPNCKYKTCDLPGQCVSEGKCHHPRKLQEPELELESHGRGGAVFSGDLNAWVGYAQDLKMQLDAAKDLAEIMQGREAEARYELDAAKRDALRYRWLRNYHGIKTKSPDFISWSWLFLDDADAACDAALAQQKDEPHGSQT